MRNLYLLDSSVIQRIHRSLAVKDATLALLSDGLFASCLPQVLEEGFSARNHKEWEQIMSASRAAKVFLDPIPDVAEHAQHIQGQMFTMGIGRAAGVSDIQIAATALAHTTADQRVTIVHYDSDFDAISRAAPQLRTRWIVPRGSVD